MTIKLYEVGGSIRDEFLGLQTKDRDFCAEAPSWEVLLAWCHSNMSKVFLVTPEYFTIRGAIGKDAIDIVLCRNDGKSSDGRRPDEVWQGTILEDLSRRDFTINAMARQVNPKTLEVIDDLIDPFKGMSDLNTKILRCVGKTEDRFKEDGLRLLRAARFKITKNLHLDISLSIALQEQIWWNYLMNTVSAERIREELHKMFLCNTAKSIRFLAECAPYTVETLFSGHSKSLWLEPTNKKRKSSNST